MIPDSPYQTPQSVRVRPRTPLSMDIRSITSASSDENGLAQSEMPVQGSVSSLNQGLQRESIMSKLAKLQAMSSCERVNSMSSASGDGVHAEFPAQRFSMPDTPTLSVTKSHNSESDSTWEREARTARSGDLPSSSSSQMVSLPVNNGLLP